MKIMGIDPGLSGAVALLQAEYGILDVTDIPVLEVIRGGKKKRELDEDGLAALIRRYHPDVAYVEAVGAMPKQGVSSVFSFGRTYGTIRGILAACNIERVYVHPTTWKRAVGLIAGATKDMSRRIATERFPRNSGFFTRVKDDGRAEAALIALYGYGLRGPKP